MLKWINERFKKKRKEFVEQGVTQPASIFRFPSVRMPVSIHVIDKDSAGVGEIWIRAARNERCEKKGLMRGGEAGSWRAVGRGGHEQNVKKMQNSNCGMWAPLVDLYSEKGKSCHPRSSLLHVRRLLLPQRQHEYGATEIPLARQKAGCKWPFCVLGYDSKTWWSDTVGWRDALSAQSRPVVLAEAWWSFGRICTSECSCLSSTCLTSNCHPDMLQAPQVLGCPKKIDLSKIGLPRVVWPGCNNTNSSKFDKSITAVPYPSAEDPAECHEDAFALEQELHCFWQWENAVTRRHHLLPASTAAQLAGSPNACLQLLYCTSTCLTTPVGYFISQNVITNTF